MAWTKYQIFLSALMVLTGSINTLGTKWSTRISSKGRDGIVHKFIHPFFQSAYMFIGEMMCLVAFKILYYAFRSRGDGTEDTHTLTKGSRKFNPIILIIPAICDLTATSLMYIGLNLTYASSFEMLRGAVIIFVAILSMIFLRRRLKWFEWVGLAIIIIGLTLVGLADFLVDDSKNETYGKRDRIIGDLIVIVAQVIQAVQMVVEEKFVRGLEIPPLQAIGWEGIFGFGVAVVLIISFYYVKAVPPWTYIPSRALEDAGDAFIQMGNRWELTFSIVLVTVSIAFYNYSGISITRERSAITRKVLDSIRTIIIWAFSLGLFGQKFHYLQLLGFLVLLTGMFLYMGVTPKTLHDDCRTCCQKMRHREEPAPQPSTENVEKQLPEVASATK